MDVIKNEIIQKILNRLPSYTDLVPKLRGDTDGLRMCGYEKEIDHVVQKFSLQNKNILEICTGIGVCGILLARNNHVLSFDVNPQRTSAAQENARLFGVDKNIKFFTHDVCDDYFPTLVSQSPDLVFIDCDWRADMNKDRLPSHSPDPFTTCPKADDVYRIVMKNFTSIIAYKVSARSDVERFRELGACEIVSFIKQDEVKFYHVYFYPNPTPSSVVILDS